MTLGGHSIPAVAPKREADGLLFCTPPGSPFRALPPYEHPLMEPTCRHGEKKLNTVGGPH